MAVNKSVLNARLNARLLCDIVVGLLEMPYMTDVGYHVCVKDDDKMCAPYWVKLETNYSRTNCVFQMRRVFQELLPVTFRDWSGSFRYNLPVFSMHMSDNLCQIFMTDSQRESGQLHMLYDNVGTASNFVRKSYFQFDFDAKKVYELSFLSKDDMPVEREGGYVGSRYVPKAFVKQTDYVCKVHDLRTGFLRFLEMTDKVCLYAADYSYNKHMDSECADARRYLESQRNCI